MMPGQRQAPYIAGHPMSLSQRPMRPNRPIYSTSPQGPTPMQGYMAPPQNMPYQVLGQVSC